ncbi:MAG: hypothetical protein ABSD99_10320 [Candidatus Bathyarchaeia archaeon]
MSARTTIGVVMSILGLLLLLYSGYEFNNLFFIDRLLAVSGIPAYNSFVVTPFLLGILAQLDGSVVLGLKRSFSLSIHLLGNLVWLYALYILYDNLAIPITDITAYHQVFLLSFLGLIFFVIGVIANDIPKRKMA